MDIQNDICSSPIYRILDPVQTAPRQGNPGRALSKLIRLAKSEGSKNTHSLVSTQRVITRKNLRPDRGGGDRYGTHPTGATRRDRKQERRAPAPERRPGSLCCLSGREYVERGLAAICSRRRTRRRIPRKIAAYEKSY